MSLGRLPRRAGKAKVSGRIRAPEDFRIKLVSFGRYIDICVKRTYESSRAPLLSIRSKTRKRTLTFEF